MKNSTAEMIASTASPRNASVARRASLPTVQRTGRGTCSTTSSTTSSISSRIVSTTPCGSWPGS
jgi:hypothetical protein